MATTPLLTDDEKTLRALVRQLNGYAYSQGEADAGASWTTQDKYDRLVRETEDRLIAAIDALRGERDAARASLTMARAHIVWLAFGECRSPGWTSAPPSASETVAAIDAQLALSPTTDGGGTTAEGAA